jgi:hypothetical protein
MRQAAGWAAVDPSSCRWRGRFTSIAVGSNLSGRSVTNCVLALANARFVQHQAVRHAFACSSVSNGPVGARAGDHHPYSASGPQQLSRVEKIIEIVVLMTRGLNQPRIGARFWIGPMMLVGSLSGVNDNIRPEFLH